MTISKPPPPLWGNDELTAFLDTCREHQFEVFVNRKPHVSNIVAIDQCFSVVIGEIGKMWGETSPFALLMRSHSAYRASTNCALAGQFAELQPLLRLMLEQAGYAMLIKQNPILQEVFLTREDSKENRAKVRKEFNRQRIDAALTSWNERIRESWCDLYEMTIAFGAHPNELSITSGMRIRRDEDAAHIQYLYMQDDVYALDFGLVSLQRVAECVLRIFQELFPMEFGSSGVSSKLVELQKDLRGFKLDLSDA